MCVCFQQRRVRHNANDIPYAKLPAYQERNLHCDIHVAAENKHTLLPFGSLASLSIASVSACYCIPQCVRFIAGLCTHYVVD